MNLNQCLKSPKIPHKKYNHIPSSSTSETQLLVSRHNVDSVNNSSKSSLTENDEFGNKVKKLTGFPMKSNHVYFTCYQCVIGGIHVDCMYIVCN